MIHDTSLDTLCAALAYAMKIERPAQAAEPCEKLVQFIDSAFSGSAVDRIFMYNPDAIPQWIYEKYHELFVKAKNHADIEQPFCTVMPSVTPVGFGTMYTGAQPEVHGIQSYTKPVITIDTIFDALIRAGKKCAMVTSEKGCSLATIFLQREMDYFDCATVEEANAVAAELILADTYDFIVVYNDNYDTKMHRWGPEGIIALGEARANVEAFAMFSVLIEKHWKQHNTIVGFAMDHGCHEIDGGAGSHGLAMEEDLNIVHLYKAYPACEV